MTPIILKPIITERALRQAALGEFTFMVSLEANKHSLAQEVAKRFKVHPVVVRTQIVKGKIKRGGRSRKPVARSDWKKAVVKLTSGEKIDLFETGGTQNA